MSGTVEGGKRAARTNKLRYGAQFYSIIGSIGGRKGTGGGFASKKVGADGLTGRQRARYHGSIGGQVSKRIWTAEQRQQHSEAAKDFHKTRKGWNWKLFR